MNAGCALYASVGPVLHRYVLDPRSGTLAWQKSLRMPEAVQFAWPSPTGAFVYAVCNNGKPSRLLRSAWTLEWARGDTPDPLPNPLQPMTVGRYMAQIDRAAATENINPYEGPGALASTPVGQVVGLMNSEASCRQVVREMMEGCVDAVARVQAKLEDG